MPSCNPDFSHIGSYLEASERLRGAKPFPETDKSDPHAAYRLEATRKRHMNIRLMDESDLRDLYRKTYGEVSSWNGVNTTPLSTAMFEANCDKRHIALQLYQTDVVVYREDEVIFLTPYVSNSTNAFVSQCTPSHLSTTYEPRACMVKCWDDEFTASHDEEGWWGKHQAWKATHRVYRIASRKTVAFGRLWAGGGWAPLEGSGFEPWDLRRVDRKAAQEALKQERFVDFKLWVLGWLGMNPTLPYRNREKLLHGSQLPTPLIMSILRGEGGWEVLPQNPHAWPVLNRPNGYGPGSAWRRMAWDRLNARIDADPRHITKLHLERLCERVRMAIYETHQVVHVEHQDFILGYTNVTSWQKNSEAYPWL